MGVLAARPEAHNQRHAEAAKKSDAACAESGGAAAQREGRGRPSGCTMLACPMSCGARQQLEKMHVQVCEAVRREVPTDEQILNIMSIVYRRANRMKDMSAAFAAASAAHPRDEGLLRGVFVSYVRQVSIHCLTSACCHHILFTQQLHFNIEM